MKCQICGAAKGLKADGTIRLHHRRSEVCPGSGQKPWEISCDVLDSEIERLQAADRHYTAWFSRYLKGNRPPADDELGAWRRITGDLLRLTARRKRWDKRNWVEYWCGETERFRKRPPDDEQVAA